MSPRRDKTLTAAMAFEIKKYRKKMFPGHGGQKKCAERFTGKELKTASEWADWEAGRKTPDLANQRKLAQFFGITLGELRGEKAPPAKASGANIINPQLVSLFEAFDAVHQMMNVRFLQVMRGEFPSEDFRRILIEARRLGMTGAGDVLPGRRENIS